MLRKIIKITGLTALMAVLFTMTSAAQNISKDYDSDQNRGQYKVDRYLTVEVWPNHTDGEYFEGDDITISFLTNRDAFVAIYSVDSRGRVNLLFPSAPNQDNFIEGGHTYRLPGPNDDFDYVVNGPEGVENIQIIASRERFPIPDWYPTSGLIDDWEDRFDFMDYVNSRFFVRYDGQRFAFDRTAVYINEWEPDYYQPVYYPDYPSWTVYGNAYIDYPYGGSVYINGIYWGIAPLYIPRIYVGWHTFSIYDSYGYCWENDIHISRYNTVVLNRSIVRPRSTVVSKYKDVRTVGYRDPVRNGYPNYKTKKTTIVSKQSGKTSVSKTTTIKKRYAKGSSTIVKTNRGYETVGKKVQSTGKRSNSYNKSYNSGNSKKSGSSSQYKSKSSSSSKSGRSSSRIYNKKSGSSISKGTATKKSSSKIKSKKPSSSKSSSGKKATVKKQKSSSKDKPAKKSSIGKKGKTSSKSSSKSFSRKSSSKSKSSSKKSGGKGKP